MSPQPGISRGAPVHRHSPAALLLPLGTHPPREVRIGARRIVLGADSRCDFVLDNPTVSRRHAALERHEGAVLLTDLGSTNGTFVNGRRVVSSVTLSPGDQVRLGAVTFRYEGPGPARRRACRWISRGAAIAASAGLTVAIATLVIFVRFKDEVRSVPGLARTSNVHSYAPASTGATVGSGWLTRLNYYRKLAKLALVKDEPSFSGGDAAHARYLVVNEAEAIRTGRIGASMHSEEPGKLYFSGRGLEAARLSDVDTEYSSPPVAPPPAWAVENWMSGPFHRMWLLNPELARVGYGQFCEGGVCAAALNVQSGIDHLDHAGVQVVMFPPDRATITRGVFGTNVGEWPNPLTSCPGYTTPTGVPITLQLGIDTSAVLQSYSLEKNGAPVEACGFDAGSYRNPDPISVKRARSGLRHFGAVIIVPRKPLVPGATYLVRATVSGTPYAWSFTVARRDLALRAAAPPR